MRSTQAVSPLNPAPALSVCWISDGCVQGLIQAKRHLTENGMEIENANEVRQGEAEKSLTCLPCYRGEMLSICFKLSPAQGKSVKGDSWRWWGAMCDCLHFECCLKYRMLGLFEMIYYHITSAWNPVCSIFGLKFGLKKESNLYLFLK